jgi:mRNA-degrading endonuclease RelE of RelBE toxin-antitoxin system
MTNQKKKIIKEDVINIRVDPSLKKELKKLADLDSRTLGDFIRLNLRKIVESYKNNG